VEALQSGYVVRGAVRSEGKIDAIKKAPSIQPFLDRLQFVIVSDILQEGAFDKALEGVDYVLHLASPLPVEV
jgi:nucleoside-diphosphate-sugar epimerase